MKRALLIAIALLVLPNLALLLTGYGIRIREKPCTHYIGFFTYENYIAKVCPRFGKWELAMTPVAPR